MQKVINKFIALSVLILGVFSMSVSAQTLPFKSVSYTYTQGAFAGAQYELTFPEGKVRWEGLAGEEKGLSAVEETSQVVDLGDSKYMVTWLEKNGLTITAILDIQDKTINAVASMSAEHYVLSGNIDSVK